MRKILFCILLLFCVKNAFAQQFDCGTDQMMQKLSEQNPDVYQKWLESTFDPNVYQVKVNKTSDEDKVYVIPVVVHVMHNDGIEKISEEQVISQMNALNHDFRKTPGTIGWGSGVDMRIEFHLATIDPEGNPTNGIVYYKTPLTVLRGRDRELKSLSRWNPDRYMNVYIVKEISDGVNSSTLGYAFFPVPGNGMREQDGIVIIADRWGTIGDIAASSVGRVAPHEYGHWLSLHHPFNYFRGPDGCEQGDCRRTGDGVCDTPPSEKQNFGTPDRLNSCGYDDPDMPDNTRNYMDYTNDLSKDMFTLEQRNRAHATLENESQYQRYFLWQRDNHRRTGVGKFGIPSAQFWAENLNPCVNTPVQFTDYSFNTPDQYFWYFPGGIPETSTAKNPVVIYPKSGRYDVHLTVKNIARPEDSTVKVMPKFITVHDTLIKGAFSEGFEGETFPPSGWKIINEDQANSSNNYTFEIYKNIDGNGGGFLKSKQSVVLRHASYNGYGQTDGLISPSIDMTGLQDAKLFFSYSYRPFYTAREAFPLFYNDTLSVLVSDDCGNSWQPLYHKGGEDLRTARFELSLHIPKDASEWRRDSISLKSFVQKGTIQIKFQTTNGNGNYLYLDDIQLKNTAFPAGVSALKQLSEWITLQPNPVQNSAELNLNLPQKRVVSVHIMDCLGKMYWQSTPINIAVGSIGLPMEDLAEGVYFAKIHADDQMVVLKLVKTK